MATLNLIAITYIGKPIDARVLRRDSVKWHRVSTFIERAVTREVVGGEGRRAWSKVWLDEGAYVMVYTASNIVHTWNVYGECKLQLLK